MLFHEIEVNFDCECGANNCQANICIRIAVSEKDTMAKLQGAVRRELTDRNWYVTDKDRVIASGHEEQGE